ncbi:DUF3987 domain-containing protein [Amphibacillus sp. MSJ-3]|uniref:DUF3987 domain-containing protein n=1 Tax=Amphibacillus sp. MSJ-3 TaxID=2841505 RepID=UPI001C0ED8E1|nr:DUF3987 domain-containing protein [Amphibacillus sp. MSJ-3]
MWNKPLKINLSEPIEFPIEVLPDWIANYVLEIKKELNTSLELPITAVLSALSATLTKKIKFIHGNWRLDLNLYQILTAPPSSKKDAVLNKVFNTFKEKEVHNEEIGKLKIKMNILEAKYKVLEKKIGSATTEDVERKIENEMLSLRNNINDYKKIIYNNISIITGDITQEKTVDILANKV